MPLSIWVLLGHYPFLLFLRPVTLTVSQCWPRLQAVPAAHGRALLLLRALSPCPQPQGAHRGQGHPCSFAVSSAAQFSPKTNTSSTNWNTPLWVLTPQLWILHVPPEAGQQDLGETGAPGRGAEHVESRQTSPSALQPFPASHTAIRIKILPRLSPHRQGWVSGAEHEACKQSCPGRNVTFLSSAKMK